MGTTEQEQEQQQTAAGAPATIDQSSDELASVEEALLDASVTFDTPPEEIMRNIVMRTLQAQSPQDVLAPERVLHARDLIGVPLEVRAVKWNRSSMEAGPQVYAVLDAVHLGTGERFPVTIGAARAMAQLLALSKLQAYPVKVRILEADRETAAGYRPLRLEAVQEEAPPEG